MNLCEKRVQVDKTVNQYSTLKSGGKAVQMDSYLDSYFERISVNFSD